MTGMNNRYVSHLGKVDIDGVVPVYRIVYDEIMRTIGSIPPETGGILGMKDNCISSFYYDEYGSGTDNTYIPDFKRINDVLQMWNLSGIEFAGIIHSHPSDMRLLSYADIRYAVQIMNENDLSELYFPLVMPDTKELLFYKVSGSGKVTIHNELIIKN